MTRTVPHSAGSPPTLFRLRAIGGRCASAGQRTRASASIAKSSDEQTATIYQARDDQTLTLRIDRAERTVPPPSSAPATATERRLARFTRRIAPKPELRPRSAADRDLIHDHIGDLICNLSAWSMRLDRRESELDQREDSLNRQLRLLRQHHWAE